MTIAVMALVATVALVIFVDGFLSLILDRDVIEQADAGPLVGPAMVAVTCAVVLFLVVRQRPVSVVGRSVSALLATIVLSPLVGGILYAAGQGSLGIVPVFFGEYVTNPFVLCSGAIAGTVVFLAWLAGRSGRPTHGEGA